MPLGLGQGQVTPLVSTLSGQPWALSLWAQSGQPLWSSEIPPRHPQGEGPVRESSLFSLQPPPRVTSAPCD